MVEKIQFALLHYAQLTIFVVSCFGMGIWPIKLSKQLASIDKIFSTCLTITLGMGMFILALQALGIFGLLNKFYVTVLLLTGHVGLLSNIAFQPRHEGRAPSTQLTSEKTALKKHWFFLAVLALIAIDMFPMPLHPPIDWDEVMYHLPHARDWVTNGRLTINEWLRYPLFPYNFNLLYSAGLSYGDEIFPHMVNALAGWLVAIGLFRLADSYFNRAVASISVLLFVCLTLSQYGGAMADLGVALFVFFGFACLFIWREKKNFPILCIAAFLIGVAAGIKYQALIFIPLFAVVVLLRERRPLHLLGLLVLFALPCLYWYLRNYLIAGDPFNPMGARIFGYWGWNAGDMALQLADIKRVADWPKVYVWPALGAVFLRSKFGCQPFVAALVFSIYAFIVWIFTSHYSRYLMPAFPFIALLTAIVINHLYTQLIVRSNLTSSSWKSQFFVITQNTLAALFLAVLSTAVFISSLKEWKLIQTTAEGRSTFLRTQIKSFEISEFLQHHPEYRVVQIDLESDLYYLPANTIGDVFGPGRYRDFDGLSSAELANRLKSFRTNAILLSTQSAESQRILERKDFLDYFVPIKKTSNAELYGLK